MGDIWSLVGQAVVAIGGVGAIVVFLTYWLGNRWAERLHLKWKHEYDSEIEELRSNLSSRQELLGSAIASASASYIAAQERRLDAVEKLWTTVLKIREYSGQFLFLYEILTPSEIEGPESLKLIPPITEAEFFNKFNKIGESLEERRPYLGERLWALFFVYRAVSGRVSHKVVKGHNERHIYPWDKDFSGGPDSHLTNLLQLVLTKDELENIQDMKMAGFRMTIRLLEEKILAEANLRISGSSAAKISIEGGLHTAEMLRQAEQTYDHAKS